jgi:hypothetical protein
MFLISKITWLVSMEYSEWEKGLTIHKISYVVNQKLFLYNE